MDFHISANFNLAKENLKIRARKASFKLCSMINPREVDPKVAISLFNSLVKPVATYASEVWGLDSLGKTPLTLFQNLFKLKADVVTFSYARYTLGLHKKASNAAVIGELGLLPCSVHAAKQAIKYVTHLTESAPDTLLHNCWNSIKNTSAPGTWPRKFVDMCSVIGANHENKVPGILAEFSPFFQKAWENLVTRPDGKLRTYSKFKPKLGLEKYLSDVKNLSHRHALCRLRTSTIPY